MSKSNMDIINFISEGMTSVELLAVIKLLDTKYEETREAEKKEQVRLRLINIKTCLLAGEPVSIEDIEWVHHQERTGYISWKNGMSYVNDRINWSLGDREEMDIQTWRKEMLEVAQIKMKEHFNTKRRLRMEAIEQATRHRINNLRRSLIEKAKLFDLTKMNELPEFIGGYCLEFLSTPEKETRCPDQMEQDYLNRHNHRLQRPSQFWLQVIDHCWIMNWQEKYLPLLLTNYKAKTFNRIKEIMAIIYNSLVMPKFSKSSKKAFLEQLALWRQPYICKHPETQRGNRLILLKFVLGSRLL